MKSPSKMNKIEIDVNKIKAVFNDQPKKKKAVQTALNIDRSIMSKILANKRKLEGGELLTVAYVLNKNPFEFALEE